MLYKTVSLLIVCVITGLLVGSIVATFIVLLMI